MDNKEPAEKVRCECGALMECDYTSWRDSLPPLLLRSVFRNLEHFRWTCPNPDHEKIVSQKEDQAKRREAAAILAKVRANLEDHLAAAGVPKIYLLCSFDNFEGAPKTVELLRQYASNFIGSTYLFGGSGSGKTHLAVAVLREGICQGFVGKVIFKTAPDLLLEIRGTFSNSSDSNEPAIIGKYCSADLLVLDDLGAEKSTEYAIQTLYLIIDKRLSEGMPMIVTSNLSPSEIARKLNPRIASRLSAYKVIKLTQGDRRKMRKKEDRRDQ